jgi:hypothetical protein
MNAILSSSESFLFTAEICKILIAVLFPADPQSSFFRTQQSAAAQCLPGSAKHRQDDYSMPEAQPSISSVKRKSARCC